MNLRRSSRQVGSTKSASTPGPPKRVPDTSGSTADADIVVTTLPRPPQAPPSAPVILAPVPQTNATQLAQGSTPLAYQGLDMQQMWFPSMEAARRHTVTAWKPHCSEQDVPITDNEKAPFVHFIRNCMLDFSSVHGNATTSNAVQEGRFPKHYYEAAADAASTLHLQGKQNRGEADPTVSRAGVVNYKHRNMRFGQRINTMGLLFKHEKKTVWDAIKGEKDLEYLCAMAPEVRASNLEKDRTNNGKRTKVLKTAGGKRSRDEADEVRDGEAGEGREELGSIQQQHPLSGGRGIVGQPSPSPAAFSDSALASLSPGSQGFSSASHSNTGSSPNFFNDSSTRGNTPYSLPISTPRDLFGGSINPSSRRSSAHIDSRRAAALHNAPALHKSHHMATSGISAMHQRYANGNQGTPSGEQDNDEFNMTNNPNGDAFIDPSSFAYDTQQPPTAQSFGYSIQQPMNDMISGNPRRETNTLDQDIALSTSYLPPRVHYSGSFSPSFGLQPPVLGEDPKHFATSNTMSFHQPAPGRQHQPASPVIDPRLMAEYAHGHVRIATADLSHEQVPRQIQRNEQLGDGDADEELEVGYDPV